MVVTNREFIGNAEVKVGICRSSCNGKEYYRAAQIKIKNDDQILYLEIPVESAKCLAIMIAQALRELVKRDRGER